MKKLILLLTVVLLVSCKDPNKITVNVEEYDKLTNNKNSLYVDGKRLQIHVGSDNHQYIKQNAYGDNYIYTHYIDCQKCLITKDSIKS